MHVIVDRGNKNTIVSEYTSAAKNLPWCMNPPQEKIEQNSVFPISGFDGNSVGGIFFAILSILMLVLCMQFFQKIQHLAVHKIRK